MFPRPRARASFRRVTVADRDRSEQVPGPRESPRTYVRGGHISDMLRLLERNETEIERRLVWRLVMAGIAIAVVVVATLWFLGG